MQSVRQYIVKADGRAILKTHSVASAERCKMDHRGAKIVSVQSVR